MSDTISLTEKTAFGLGEGGTWMKRAERKAGLICNVTAFVLKSILHVFAHLQYQ